MTDYLLPVNDGLILREAGEWAREKLDYLERYIDIFETSMKGKWKVRFYIDLCAGPGKNLLKKSGDILLGSPLLALTTRFPFTNYRFFEMDDKNADSLSQRCTDPSISLEIKILKGDANYKITEIIPEIPANSLNLAFIDPEGADIAWTTMTKLGRVPRMDLIIYYPELALQRNMDAWYTSQGETKMDLFFGSREWRKIYERWKHKPKLSGIHSDLIQFYKSNLVKLGYKFIKDGSLISPVMNNTKGGHLYRLIFASKHDLGANFWNQITKRNVHGQKRLL